MGLRILVVEDDLEICNALSELLEQDGHHVATAWDGASALASLNSAAALPELLLLDLVMYGMNGVDFCVALQANRAWDPIKLVLMTGAQVIDAALIATATRSVRYLKKPFDVDALGEAVQWAAHG